MTTKNKECYYYGSLSRVQWKHKEQLNQNEKVREELPEKVKMGRDQQGMKEKGQGGYRRKAFQTESSLYEDRRTRDHMKTEEQEREHIQRAQGL